MSSPPILGQITIETGATPTEQELRSATYYTEQGLNVKFLKPSTVPNIRTPDLEVEGIGEIDFYHPEITTQAEAIIRAIKKKGSQTATVHIDLPQGKTISDSEAQNIPKRVFLGTGGSGIKRIIITTANQLIIDAHRDYYA
jgi:Contact-dependent growth inhibition CdiA C-terminal domain